MFKKSAFIFILMVFIFGCKNQNEDAQSIIDKSIEISGGEVFNNSIMEFNFRDNYYLAKRNKGNYLLDRIIVSENDSILDRIKNNSFKRFVNGKEIIIPDSMASKFSASVNSVHYFSVLPFGLNSQAVIKQYLGRITLRDEVYYKIKVTFNKEGGGEDFEDVFVYWINTASYKVDYLAYSYNEAKGKGLRFREAYNERYINGIRFVDYNNYKPVSEIDATVYELDELFEKEALNLLSKIELKNINVAL